MLSFRKLLALFIVAMFGVAGCSTNPHVVLTKINKIEDVQGDEVDSFYLRRSVIEVDGESVESLVKEHEKFKIGVRLDNEQGRTTDLNLEKIQNTALIKRVGIRLTDSGIDSIEKVFLNAEPATKRVKPKALIDINDVLREGKVGKEGKDFVATKDDSITISFGKIAADAVALDDIEMPIRTKDKGFIYSACRSATVALNGVNIKTVKVNDPRYVQFVSLPDSATLTFHSICGVSIHYNKALIVRRPIIRNYR